MHVFLRMAINTTSPIEQFRIETRKFIESMPDLDFNRVIYGKTDYGYSEGIVLLPFKDMVYYDDLRTIADYIKRVVFLYTGEEQKHVDPEIPAQNMIIKIKNIDAGNNGNGTNYKIIRSEKTPLEIAEIISEEGIGTELFDAVYIEMHPLCQHRPGTLRFFARNLRREHRNMLEEY
ncbi:MAG: hypothetical protein ABIF08_04795 [Nanoarchaeota archaeon]